MTIQSHNAFSCVRPDEVVERWDGVFNGDTLYEELLACVGHYENIEGMDRYVGINCVKQFWDSFSPENQAKLNKLAVERDFDLLGEELKYGDDP